MLHQLRFQSHLPHYALIFSSQVMFPMTHSSGIQRIMTTASNMHSLLQKLNSKHYRFNHVCMTRQPLPLQGPDSDLRLWRVAKNVPRVCSLAVNTNYVHMKRCPCSSRCPWASVHGKGKLQLHTVPSLPSSPASRVGCITLRRNAARAMKRVGCIKEELFRKATEATVAKT